MGASLLLRLMNKQVKPVRTIATTQTVVVVDEDMGDDAAAFEVGGITEENVVLKDEVAVVTDDNISWEEAEPDVEKDSSVETVVDSALV